MREAAGVLQLAYQEMHQDLCVPLLMVSLGDDHKLSFFL
jgi:hypothetical protein